MEYLGYSIENRLFYLVTVEKDAEVIRIVSARNQKKSSWRLKALQKDLLKVTYQSLFTFDLGFRQLVSDLVLHAFSGIVQVGLDQGLPLFY
jgi:hypothetical protein